MIGVREDQSLDPWEPSAAGEVLQVGVVVSLDVDQTLETLARKVREVVDADVQVLQLGQLGEGVVVDQGDFVVRQVPVNRHQITESFEVYNEKGCEIFRVSKRLPIGGVKTRIAPT